MLSYFPVENGKILLYLQNLYAKSAMLYS